MTGVVLSGIAGSLLSLVFEWVPGVESWYGQKSPVVKRLVMILFLVLAGAGVYGMACAGLLDDFNWSLSCDEAGLTKLLSLIMAAAISNQTVHALVKKS